MRHADRDIARTGFTSDVLGGKTPGAGRTPGIGIGKVLALVAALLVLAYILGPVV